MALMRFPAEVKDLPPLLGQLLDQAVDVTTKVAGSDLLFYVVR